MSKFDNIQDEVIDELYKEFNISKFELNKMVSAQFRLIEKIIKGKKSNTTINCIHLGKWTPYQKQPKEDNTSQNESTEIK